MSNVVRTWKDGANAAGEIELTDAQLEAVYGAQGDDDGFSAQQEKDSSETITKNVIFFAENLSIQKNKQEKASIHL